MVEALADFVRQRAGNCCEYWRLPQALSSTRFQFDHAIAAQHGGRTAASRTDPESTQFSEPSRCKMRQVKG